MNEKHTSTSAAKSPKAVVEELIQLLDKDLKAREKNTSWLRENWLNLIQVMILVLGGLWSLYLFGRFDSLDKTIATELSRINLAKSQAELSGIQAKSIDYRGEVSINVIGISAKADEAIFDVVYTIDVKNASSKPITITSIIVQSFYHPPLQHGNERAIERPDLEIGYRTGWEPLFAKGYVSEENWPANATLYTPDNLFIPHPIKNISGGGILQPEEPLGRSAALEVRSKRFGYIGFVAYVNYSKEGKELQASHFLIYPLHWKQ